MKQYFILLQVFVFVVFFVASCSDEDTPSIPEIQGAETLNLQGPLEVKRPEFLTEQTKVFVIWVTGDGGPVSLFGEGYINLEASTFQITLDGELPAEAQLSDGFGLGFIVATNDSDLQEGQYPDGLEMDRFVGLAGDHGVIYKSANELFVDSQLPWTENFTKGYTLGRGTEIDNYDFEGFIPETELFFQLVIDFMDNIEITNWT